MARCGAIEIGLPVNAKGRTDADALYLVNHVLNTTWMCVYGPRFVCGFVDEWRVGTAPETVRALKSARVDIMGHVPFYFWLPLARVACLRL